MKSLLIGFTCLVFIVAGSNVMGLTLEYIEIIIFKVDLKIEKIEGEIKVLESKKKIAIKESVGLKKAILNAKKSLTKLKEDRVEAQYNTMFGDRRFKIDKQIKEKEEELAGLEEALKEKKDEIEFMQLDIDEKNRDIKKENAGVKKHRENLSLCIKQGLKPTDTCPPEKKKIKKQENWMELLQDPKRKCEALYNIIKQARPTLVEEIRTGEEYFDVFSLYALRSLVTFGKMQQLPCEKSSYWVNTIDELSALTKAVCKPEQQQICLRYILYGEVPPEK